VILVTGATGYLGSYAVTELLERTSDRLALLVRAPDRDAAVARLWKSLQLHLDPEAFRAALPRLEPLLGDLHAPGLGLDDKTTERLSAEVDSVLHIAASLNRKSEKACLNTNLRGALSVVQLARRIADTSGLRRFTFVSTVAVAGERQGEVVHEEDAVDWGRHDYDPYARTKKFGEHLVRTLLSDVSTVIVRPSIVLGDSRRPETTQFDMVRATFTLADLPVAPLRRDARLDIVNADFVGRALVKLHLKPQPTWDTYHLSAGTSAPTAGALSDAVREAAGRRRQRFAPRLDRPFEWTFRAMNRLPRGKVQSAGAVMKVFWPYITFDTVFANRRVLIDTGEASVSFVAYGGDLYRWCREHRYRYPYVPLPAAREAA